MGRYLRWQAAIALLGIILLAALLRYTAYNFTSVTVPERGGTLVEGVAGNPQYLNPLLSQYNQVDGVLGALLFNGLTRLDERGNVVPDLAESFVVSPDGLTYDFRLRSGLYWHDGLPVTAADVLYTIGAMQAEAFPGVTWLSTLWRAVEVSAPEGPEGLAIRADDLSIITADYAQELVDNGLTTIIDLRSREEVGFTGRGALATMIGNAVPPALAGAIAP